MNAAAYTLMSRLHYGEEEEKNARTLVLQCSAYDARPRGKVTPVVVDGSRHPRRRRRPHIPLILQARFPIPIHWNPLKLLHPFASLCSSCRSYRSSSFFPPPCSVKRVGCWTQEERGGEEEGERERYAFMQSRPGWDVACGVYICACMLRACCVEVVLVRWLKLYWRAFVRGVLLLPAGEADRERKRKWDGTARRCEASILRNARLLIGWTLGLLMARRRVN